MKLKEYKSLYQSDIDLLSATRGGGVCKKSIKLRIVRLYRFCSVNKYNFWGKIFDKLFLRRLALKSGIGLSRHTQIGYGLVIGHSGRIIINSNAVIGNNFVISPGVVIGADMRGKRKGVPTIGNRVCIHSNAVVVGNIKIGDDVVIAPNAFVNFDVPDHSIVIGNPGMIKHKENATEGFIGIVYRN